MLNKLNEVLDLFTPERRELAPLEIVELLGRPKSTVYRLLSAIEAAGFLDRDGDSGRYRLSIRFAALGELAKQSTSLQRIMLPALLRLSAETQETATLMILGDGEGITVNVIESHQPLMVPGLLGGHLPLHATAGGKTLLAWRSDEEIHALLSRPLRSYTRDTITDPELLWQQLEEGRVAGYTVVRGEWHSDIWGVAAPIRDHLGIVESTLTLGGPRSRVTEERFPALAEVVMRAAAAVSTSLGYTGTHRLRDMPHPGRRRIAI